MLICEPTSVPGDLHDTDIKASIIHVKSPAHHAKLIYPVVRAVLMRWDVVGMRPADSTLRSAANQYGTGDVTLAHVLAGVTSHHDQEKARRIDDDHLQGVTSAVTPPPQAALYCPGAARQYLENEFHFEFQGQPHWTAEPKAPLPWPADCQPFGAPAQAGPPPGLAQASPGAAAGPVPTPTIRLDA